MIRVLVPMEAFSHLTLSAAYFALQFARRHPARVFFLILEGPGAAAEAGSRDGERWPELFQQLLQRGREQQVGLEIHHSREDYLAAIRRVAQQYNIDDIIIAVPPVEDVTYPQIQRRIELLRHQGQCHIITVKPKEVGKILQVWA
jgi:hypothetical protein